MRLLECVPNFSEGRDPALLQALAAAIGGVAGVRVLDASQDPDHNRAVVTAVGEPEALGEAVFRAMRTATERIDLSRHGGVHPRIGATDVCPFVPLRDASMPDCVTAAHALGERAGAELGLPVYFYGDAARCPERRLLPRIRRGGLELLRERLGVDPAFDPDAGPRRLHPSAGAVAIGARPFLIAFNVNLETADVELARAIARRIRESSGGLPGIRALGVFLGSQECAQVSMNVCDFRRTSLVRAFEEVERLAGEAGIGVRGSELVGLAPGEALDGEIARRVRLAAFDPRRHVLERLLEDPMGP